MQLDGDAEEAGAALVLADRDQGVPERRVQQERHGGDGEREAGENEKIERSGIAENVDRGKAEMERLAREATQPVVAAGKRAPPEGDVVEHLAEGDRDHGEIDAAAMHDERAEDRAGDPAQKHPQKERQRRARGEVFQRQARAIGAEPEIGGMAERQNAGEAQQEVERHGGQAQHQHARAERGVAAEHTASSKAPAAERPRSRTSTH